MPFLILNVIVSAATTLIVLVLWDHGQSPAFLSGSGGQPVAGQTGIAANVTQSPTMQPTLPPLDQTVVMIETVIGAGDINNEVLVLKRVGEGDLSLTGWKVSNGRGDSFVFPDLLLSKNGSVRLYSRSGASTVIELYWGRTDPAWRSGDTVTLSDYQGNTRATYTVP